MKPILTPEMQNIWDMLDLIENSHPYTTRATIAKILSKSRTTVSNIVNQLMDLHFVEELNSSANGRGRPGIPLTLTSNHWYALGASFLGEHWHFLIVNLLGEVVKESIVEVKDGSIEEFVQTLITGLSLMKKEIPGTLIPLIGIGTPGLVNSETGVIVRADDMGWKKVAIKEPVMESLGIPCYVMNRHRAAGLAETRYGSGKGVKNLIYIGIGNGISAAFINEGELLEGANYSAGEIGHLLIDPDGPLCGCGRYGCLQAFSSGPALVRICKEKYFSLKAIGDTLPSNILFDAIESNTLSAEKIAYQANEGNVEAIECIEKIAVQLGIAVSNLINALNPQKIIIGGPLANTGPLLANQIKKEAAIRAMPSPFSSVQIEPSSLGNIASSLGAAYLPLKYKLEVVLSGRINSV
jgi:glucokinase-like ROK family protein